MTQESESLNFINMVFAGISALGGISGLLSVIILVRHRANDKREARLLRFIEKYENNYRGGGRFLETLIPSGINLLKNDLEINEAQNSLQCIYHTHPLRNWNSEIKAIGYKRFFRHVVDRTNELTEKNIDGFIADLNNNN